MEEAAVIYQSKYGSTKQYAEWIAEELGVPLLEKSAVKPERLKDFDLVIYGGGLYAGGIAGADLVIKHPCKKLVVFTVGLADPQTTDYSPLLSKNFTPEQLEITKLFHLRGAMDYDKLGMVHKGMMAMLKKMILDKKVPEKYTEEEKGILETYGKQVSFLDKSSITPVVEYARSFLKENKSL